MPLFEFNLRKIEDVRPWGTPPKKSLHWFGLTDGDYHLDVKGKQLFRYSPEILTLWHKQYEAIDDTEFADYCVVRLWEDILDILPHILEPLPPALFEIIKSPQLQKNFENSIQSLASEDEWDEMFDLRCQATQWIWSRKLDTAYLIKGPRIWLFRYEGEIMIRWDNEGEYIDGMQPWSEIQGEEKYSVTDFLFELTLFNDRLMEQMKSRIDYIIRENPIPDVEIDLDSLANDHRDRSIWLRQALNAPPKQLETDKILQAISKLFR